MPRSKTLGPDGTVACARCGEFKDPEKDFRRGDSYCTPCRRTYQREYNAMRKATDPTYLAVRAAKQRRAYKEDPEARARRLESCAKHRAKVNERINGRPTAKPGERGPQIAPTPAAEKREKHAEADRRWQDL